jgi:hypothetical protein
VHLYADLTTEFSGQKDISASVQFDSGLTPTLCIEPPGPQSVGGGTCTPFTPNCGSGNPGDGGIGGIHPPGLVAFVWQNVESAAGTSGTLHLGTITFDAPTVGSYTISPKFEVPVDGWLDANFVHHESAIFPSATVNVVPEPNGPLLLAADWLTMGTLARFGGPLS